MDNLNQLLNEVQTITESYERVLEATGENFNIFSILQMESDEVATHSRIIAELLNPKGSHGQKDKFLLLFKDLFAKELELITSDCTVKVEHDIGPVTKESGGRIDILIRDSRNVIMIENKIFALEQENQLLRYHNAFPKGKLIFLTLLGKPSDQKSSEGFEYLPISYQENLIDWLEKCKKDAVNIPILRESISQYINLIKKLTNQNINQKMSQDIVSRVLKDVKSFDSFKSVVKSRNEVFQFVLTDFLNNRLFPFLKTIEIDKELELLISEEQLLNSTKQYLGFSFLNEQLKSLNLMIDFRFNIVNGYKNFIYGFAYIAPAKGLNFKCENLNKNFGGIPSPSYASYKKFINYENWEDLDTLKKIHFLKNDFESELKDKIEFMLNILKEVIQ